MHVLAVLMLAALPLARSSVPAERVVGNDNRHPAGVLRNGVLTLRLEARLGRWYPEADDGPSEVIQAFGEAAGTLSVPGPLIRVPQGTTIRLRIRNALDSTLVLHGLGARRGAGDDTLQIAPGAVRDVSFPAPEPGTYFYWGSTTRRSLLKRQWLDSQLSGAIVVDPAGAAPADRIFVLGMWINNLAADSAGKPGARPFEEVMVINGKSWPHTERFTYTVGDSVHWRWINASESSHPMHLHGFYYRVDTRGDGRLDVRYPAGEEPFVNTRLMQPGETMAIAWRAEREGNWIFHCHFAFHVSPFLLMTPPDTGHSAHGRHRMSGLVLGLHVNAGPRPAVATTTLRARQLRLLLQQVPKRYDTATGYGFVLQDPRAAAYRDSLPSDSLPMAGPTIVLTRGEPVAITVVNRLREQTGVHWHGIELESFPDGVPGWSGTPGRIMPPVAPGDSFVAEFVPPRSGTFLYHSHSNELSQISSGLYGALIVLEPGERLDPDRDRIFLLGSQGPFPSGGMLNGQAEPDEMELVAGRTYRFRFVEINPDWRVHFSLFDRQGLATWRPIAKDGADLPIGLRRLAPARIQAGPGETADFEFTPAEPGELRLEIATVGPGWSLPLTFRVRRDVAAQ